MTAQDWLEKSYPNENGSNQTQTCELGEKGGRVWLVGRSAELKVDYFDLHKNCSIAGGDFILMIRVDNSVRWNAHFALRFTDWERIRIESVPISNRIH